MSYTLADVVLHAITTAFTPCFSKKSNIFFEKVINSSFVFSPYGIFLVSPKYKQSSDGKSSLNCFKTVSPPTPESKNPMGLLLISFEIALHSFYNSLSSIIFPFFAYKLTAFIIIRNKSDFNKYCRICCMVDYIEF